MYSFVDHTSVTFRDIFICTQFRNSVALISYLIILMPLPFTGDGHLLGKNKGPPWVESFFANIEFSSSMIKYILYEDDNFFSSWANKTTICYRYNHPALHWNLKGYYFKEMILNLLIEQYYSILTCYVIPNWTFLRWLMWLVITDKFVADINYSNFPRGDIDRIHHTSVNNLFFSTLP